MPNSVRLLLALIIMAPGWSNLRADEADDRVEAAVKKLDGSVVRRNDLPGKPIVNAGDGAVNVASWYTSRSPAAKIPNSDDGSGLSSRMAPSAATRAEGLRTVVMGR